MSQRRFRGKHFIAQGRRQSGQLLGFVVGMSYTDHTTFL
jgi:hypothetical protein